MNEANNETPSKKPTNKDVAKLAGVSVATVSYVINQRSDQKISEETRKKVLQAVNMLNYAPNPHAVAIRNTNVKDIVVRGTANLSTLGKLDTLDFVKRLSDYSESRGYTIYYMGNRLPKRVSSLASICINNTKNEFKDFADENFAPVIALFSYINDPVFYQINTDFKRLSSKAQKALGESFTYVCTYPENEQVRTIITQSFKNVVFVSEPSDFAGIRSKNLFITQSIVNDFCKKFPGYNIVFEDCLNDVLFERVLSCVEKAVNRENVPGEEHYILV